MATNQTCGRSSRPESVGVSHSCDTEQVVSGCWCSTLFNHQIHPQMLLHINNPAFQRCQVGGHEAALR